MTGSQGRTRGGRLGIALRWAVIAGLAVTMGTPAYASKDSVKTRHIVDEAVTTKKVKDQAITTRKVQDQAITTRKVQDQAITTRKVSDQAITTTKLRDGAVNKDKLDPGTLAAEPERKVGAPGEPEFNNPGGCFWDHFDEVHHASFAREPSGFVHLQGAVFLDDPASACPSFSGTVRDIFVLPAGFRPKSTHRFAVVAGSSTGTVRIDPDGTVRVDDPTTIAQAKNRVLFDGISFRCAPSGVNGCP